MRLGPRWLASLGHVPQAKTDIHTRRFPLVAVEVPAVIRDVLADGIDDNAIRDTPIAERFAIVGIEKNGREILRTKFVCILGPCSLVPAVAFGGEGRNRAAEHGVLPPKALSRLKNRRQ